LAKTMEDKMPKTLVTVEDVLAYQYFPNNSRERSKSLVSYIDAKLEDPEAKLGWSEQAMLRVARTTMTRDSAVLFAKGIAEHKGVTDMTFELRPEPPDSALKYHVLGFLDVTHPEDNRWLFFTSWHLPFILNYLRSAREAMGFEVSFGDMPEGWLLPESEGK
jgi:hypothetical protein